ncbi:MAG: UbiX family flavin prenyltransferase [Alphaproteobacteria bacterium]|nr:UbiX family flavin prenyltransferase [Alphaproteobacteria bacterium]
MATPRRLVVGMSGASGAVLGIRLLEVLKPQDIETHLIMTKSAITTLAHETNWPLKKVRALASVWHSVDDIGAAVASGSFKTLGMVVVPCSIRSLSELAAGITANLLTRAADVALKERRRVVLVLRETPLHVGHLQNMLRVAEMGAVIAPPVPSFYTRPSSADDIVRHTVGRILDLFDIETDLVRRWGEDIPTKLPVKRKPKF